MAQVLALVMLVSVACVGLLVKSAIFMLRQLRQNRPIFLSPLHSKRYRGGKTKCNSEKIF